MNISNKGLELIKQFEGCRLKAYKCSAGKWTIGYGHTKDVVKDMTINHAQADEFLKQDVEYTVNYLNSFDREWTQNQFDALISFGYNCGVGNLKKLITARDDNEIADAMLKYTYAGGRTLRGLERRRKEEVRMFLTPDEMLGYVDYVTGRIRNDRCYYLNIRQEPNKSAPVITAVKCETKHKINVSKSVQEYWYFEDIGGYGKKDFIEILK